jgi:hypothetical protein
LRTPLPIASQSDTSIERMPRARPSPSRSGWKRRCQNCGWEIEVSAQGEST